MRSLGNLEAKVDGINERLDRINGTLEHHTEDIKDLELVNSERKGAWKVMVVIAGAVSTLIYFVLNKLL
jgi:hypothetical protein